LKQFLKAIRTQKIFCKFFGNELENFCYGLIPAIKKLYQDTVLIKYSRHNNKNNI